MTTQLEILGKLYLNATNICFFIREKWSIARIINYVMTIEYLFIKILGLDSWLSLKEKKSIK
jgi:hypothetical protein